MRLEVSVGGSLGTASDWSCTMNFMLGAAVPSPAVLQTISNAISTALKADAVFLASFCTDTTIATVKCLYYPTNVPPVGFVASTATAAVAGTAPPVHAPQVCVVASLRTGSAGRSYRGRVYVPYRGSHIAPSGAVDGSGVVAAGSFANRLQYQVRTALLAQSISASWNVWSKKLAAGIPITQILVGNQCDTIRHRNRNELESYTPYAITSVSAPDDDDSSEIEALQQEIFQGWNQDANVPPWLPTAVVQVISSIE